MLVAVESLDQPRTREHEQKQLVLIQAPVVLEATVVASGSADKLPEMPAPLVACPSCNGELRLDESKLGKPFRCPLCLRLLMAHETVESADPTSPRKIVLQKAPPGIRSHSEVEDAGFQAGKDADNDPAHSEKTEIWPSAATAGRWNADLAVRVALYAVIYVGLIVLLIGVYRQNWLISAVTFFMAGSAFAALGWRSLRAGQREQNLRAQLRSLSGRRRPAHWATKAALLGILVLVLGESVVATFAAVQSLDSPNDFYLVGAIGLLVFLVSLGPLLVSAVHVLANRFHKTGSGLLRRSIKELPKSTPLVP